MDSSTETQPREARTMSPFATQVESLEGTLLGDRYLLLEQIGEGAFGRVFRANHVIFRRQVAVKVLHAHFASDEVTLKRFRREARAAATVEHPGIAAVYDIGRAPEGDPYLAMEWVEGDNLGVVLRERYSLGVEEAVRYARDVASTLAAAHDEGIVHRDLKPENILVPAAGGHLKVTDFGLCSEDGMGRGERLTKTGQIIGTPHYFAPERFDARIVTAKSDVYALGCVLHELLSGRPPFAHDNAMDVLRAHLVEPARPVSEATDEPIPPALDRLVYDCLAKEPDARPTMAEVLRRLECPSMLQAGSAGVSGTLSRQLGQLKESALRGPRRRAAAALFAALFGFLLAAAGLALWTPPAAEAEVLHAPAAAEQAPPAAVSAPAASAPAASVPAASAPAAPVAAELPQLAEQPAQPASKVRKAKRSKRAKRKARAKRRKKSAARSGDLPGRLKPF